MLDFQTNSPKVVNLYSLAGASLRKYIRAAVFIDSSEGGMTEIP